MRPRPHYRLPADKREQLRRAARLEWLTIFFLLTIIGVMALTMGSSQAMRTAWMEDLLSLVPPIAFLAARRRAQRPPDAEHPYGHRRAMGLSFLAAAVAILAFGILMLTESAISLATKEHPTIGHFYGLGQSWPIWAGWPMIAALVYSMIPPIALGRIKLRMARELNDKTLYADAIMNKDDWMTAGAAALGIVGVGFGIWWSDAAAAGLISLNVLRDGFGNARAAMADLMDRSPTDVAREEPLHLEERLEEALRQLPEVRDVGVRLREEGETIAGEIFVVLADDGDIARRLARIGKRAASLDWRLHGLVVAPVEAVDSADA